MTPSGGFLAASQGGETVSAGHGIPRMFAGMTGVSGYRRRPFPGVVYRQPHIFRIAGIPQETRANPISSLPRTLGMTVGEARTRADTSRASNAPYGGSVVNVGGVPVNVDANRITDPEAVAELAEASPHLASDPLVSPAIGPPQ
jgi:hypothetical protein